VNFAPDERRALCDLFEQSGPDAPTLCDGWTTYDLAAHLVQRERRLDAGPGILLPPLAGYTERVRTGLLRRHSYPELVAMVREGPPRWSPFALFDAAANTVEYFVHHEDVRRQGEEWEPRELDPEFEAFLWSRLTMAKLVLRRAPAHVSLVRPDGTSLNVHRGLPQVRVHGPVSELVLWALGRTTAARVEIRGDADAAERLTRATWGL
jgi:uncharacterized protein (TIGR03085 family)